MTLPNEVTDEVTNEAVEETKESLTDVEIEEKVSKNLEKAFGDEPADENLDLDDPTPEKENPAEDTNDKDDSTPGEEIEGEVNKEEESKAKDEDADEEKTQGETSPLSDAYNRAALHRSWTQEEIDDFYESNPELANKTFAKIYEEVNRVSQEYANMGRKRKEQSSATVEQPAEHKVESPEFKGVDVDTLRKEYPDEEPLMKVIELLNEQNKSLAESRTAQESAQPTGLSPEQERALIQESAAIEQQVDTFFGSDGLKPYSDFYGKLDKSATDWNALMPGEKANRWAVIKMMDEMITGARVYGRDMNVDEALRLAHLSVTEPIREKIIRKTIQDSVTKRSDSLTLKPTSVERSESVGTKTEKDVETAVAERLKKISW